MRFSSPCRPAKACRLLFVTLGLLSVIVSAASAATLTGHVTDPDGRGVPAARVVIATPIGTAAERTTDATGRFVVETLAEGRYDVLVVATGLAADPMTIVLSRDESRDISLMLHLSGIAESIVVSAAQVDVPLSRTPDTVTVVTAADLQAQPDRNRCGCPAARAGADRHAQRRARRRHVAVSARGRSKLHARPRRRRARERFRPAADTICGHLTVADVDRIEIVRGPQSALFGSDAIGAVVQIVTRRGGPPRGDAIVEGGEPGHVARRGQCGRFARIVDVGRRRRTRAERRLHGPCARQRRTRHERR